MWSYQIIVRYDIGSYLTGLPCFHRYYEETSGKRIKSWSSCWFVIVCVACESRNWFRAGRDVSPHALSRGVPCAMFTWIHTVTWNSLTGGRRLQSWVSVPLNEKKMIRIPPPVKTKTQHNGTVLNTWVVSTKILMTKRPRESRLVNLNTTHVMPVATIDPLINPTHHSIDDSTCWMCSGTVLFRFLPIAGASHRALQAKLYSCLQEYSICKAEVVTFWLLVKRNEPITSTFLLWLRSAKKLWFWNVHHFEVVPHVVWVGDCHPLTCTWSCVFISFLLTSVFQSSKFHCHFTLVAPKFLLQRRSLVTVLHSMLGPWSIWRKLLIPCGSSRWKTQFDSAKQCLCIGLGAWFRPGLLF